jgi:hypothetical protein
MGQFSRDKGKRGERAVAQILTSSTGRKVERKVRQIDGDSDLVGFEPWTIEVKFANTLLVDQWWKQACAQADDGFPLLIYKQTRGRTWWVRVRLTDISIPSRLHVGIFEHELHVDMHLDQFLVAIGEWRPQ